MKYMNVHSKYGCNLQLFAGDDGDGDGGDGRDASETGEDVPEDDGSEDAPDEKKYSQKDLDEAIKKDRRKQQRAAAKKKAAKDTQQEDNTPPAESEDIKARKAAEDKAADLEVRVACYEAGVAKDAVEDVTALARAYMAKDEDLDLEDAIEKVVKKYPQFKASASKDPYDEEDDDKPTGKAWAGRQSGKGTPKLSGVEAKFYAMNPDLK